MANTSVSVAPTSTSLAPSALASAHAQLLLISEAIRTAVSELGLPRSRTSPPPQPEPSCNCAPQRETSSSASAPSKLNAPPISAADTAAKRVVATASDRLAALYDHLRQVQSLMKEYETVSQRAVEMHLLPTPAEAENGVSQAGQVEGGCEQKSATALRASSPPTRQATSPSPQPGAKAANEKSAETNSSSSPNTADGNAEKSGPEGPTPPLSLSGDVTGPSLYQRRALLSDAVFTHFCGLRVDSANLCLPLPMPSTAVGGASKTPQDKDGLSTNTLNACPASISGSSNQPNAGSGHSQASTTLRRTQQQRQQAAAAAQLSAYSRYFLYPKSPLKLSPTFTEADTASAIEEYLSSPFSTDPSNSHGILLRQLRDIQSQFEGLHRCNLFTYEARLRELKAAASAARQTETEKSVEGDKKLKATASAKQTAAPPVEESKWEHNAVLVDRMREVLTALRTRFTSDSHFAYCGAPAITLGRQLHGWTQPLLRQLNELLSNPTLEEVDQHLREKLHRLKFDVEELQQEQADAITNGDMQRSEELYYEQTALSESMREPYDEMEQLLDEYREECVTAPLAALQEQREALTARLSGAIEDHTTQLTEVTQDIDRVKEKRRSVIQSRHRQRNAMSAYQHKWKKEWQGNSDQQIACYHAMEQLEKRLLDLQNAQNTLADDWLAHMTLERQREEDAAAFMCFVEARSQALTESQRNLQLVVEGLRQFSGAIRFCCSHAEAFARDVLQSHINETQLALRKDRLAQFRALYLTLGDLHFKKSRNAEEIQKRVEYYTLQQEVAMDVLNPKAKEYSQAKQQWVAAKEEALEQLEQLECRSRLQLEAFRPTEQRLRDAGVKFTSPEDELAERNLQRTQRLVEYQQLIEEGIGVRESDRKPSGGAAAAAQHLPALMSNAAATATTRPFTADIHTPAPPSSSQPRGNVAAPRRATPLTDSTATTKNSASAASSFNEGSGSGLAATLPLISSKSPQPQHLHATEERIMQDVSKTATLGSRLRNNKTQKRKSPKSV
ncbi:putative paraflagellar rod protein [Leptomonas seymouri]|uniref:Putative paraflagellar rod protein n=1 Tax=Leptomonas seymouri TaxID=5684 RepID=A0A0N1I2P7_LEPSE|nr:putative paraflagellar rod protein [Leptomonas seymouri]|eukprot:KPI84030.1 putative paraflagellar rod protein [Leptomonas seymouri]